MALLSGIHDLQAPAPAPAGLRLVEHTPARGNAGRDFTPNVLSPTHDLVKKMINACSATWAAGQTAVWSFKPDPNSVRSGAWRAPVQAVAAYLRDHPELATVVIPWHEPENDFATPEQYVSLFEAVAGWMRETWPAVVLAQASLAYRYGNIKGGISDADAPRWRTSADIVCIDIYSGRTNPLATILPELASFQRWFTHVAENGRRRWGVTERGWTITGNNGAAARAATIAREAAWLASLDTPPEIYLVWNTPGAEDDKGLVLDATADSAALQLTAALRQRQHPAVPPSITGAGEHRHTITCPLCHGDGTYTVTLSG